MTIELRSVRLFQAEEKVVLAKQTVTDLAAEVVFRVHDKDEPSKDFVVDVPPIELREGVANTSAASAKAVDTNLIALGLALGTLEARIAEAEDVDALPSLLVVQPSNMFGLVVSEALMRRAATLMQWKAVSGQAHAPSR